MRLPGRSRLPFASRIFRMRFVGFRKRNKPVQRPMLLALSLAGLPLTFGATVEPSFIYCLNHDGAKIFAGREKADRDLSFGISAWTRGGQNITVFGTATGGGSEWNYSENLLAPTASERCRLDIMRRSDGMFRIRADPHATCQSHGGVN